MKNNCLKLNLFAWAIALCCVGEVYAQQNQMVYTEFDSLKTGKILFADSTELTSSLWTDNGSDISHDGDVLINSHSTEALRIGFNAGGFRFSRASSGFGLAATTGSALIFQHGNGLAQAESAIRYSDNTGNRSLSFYPSNNQNGFDPEISDLGSPALFVVTRFGNSNGVAIDTTFVPSGYKLAVHGATLTDSLTTDKISFSDGTSFTSAPTNFWIDNGSDISHDGDVLINSHSSQALQVNFNQGGFRFSRATSGFGLGAQGSGALFFQYGSGLGTQEAAIRYARNSGGQDGLIFYPQFNSVGFDPDSGELGSPALFVGRGLGRNAVGVDTTFVPVGFKLAVNGATLTDSLTTDKISFSDGTSYTSALWTDNGTDISHDGDVVITSTNSTQGLEVDFGTGGVSFSKATSGSGLGAQAGSSMIFRTGSGLGATESVIRQIDFPYGALLFYPRGTTDGFDPNDGADLGSPTLMVKTGGVAIDTTYVPSGYKLAVNGDVIAEQVDVVLSQNWPDYVFEEDYELKSLEQTASFIEENGHLPGIASAHEMEEKGVMDLADMNLKLLEKVEELTLHLIQQNNQYKEVQSQLEEVRQINKELSDRLQKLER